MSPHSRMVDYHDKTCSEQYCIKKYKRKRPYGIFWGGRWTVICNGPTNLVDVGVRLHILRRIDKLLDSLEPFCSNIRPIISCIRIRIQM